MREELNLEIMELEILGEGEGRKYWRVFGRTRVQRKD